MRRLPLSPSLWASLAVLAVGGCGGEGLVLPATDASTRIRLIQGNEQLGTTDAPLEDSLVVQVVDSANNGLPDRTVTWVVSSGGGRVSPETTTTDEDGYASAAWTLGSSAGPNALSAGAPGAESVTFTAMASDGDDLPVPSTRLEMIEGDDQSASAGSPVPIDPAVRVIDGQGRPVAGVGVTFVVTEGGGTLNGPSQTTNSDGIARVGSWTLGFGSNSLEARAGSIQGSPVVFTAIGTPSAGVDHLVFRVPPHDVRKNQLLTIEVAMVDAAGNVVPMSGIVIYVGLFPEGSEVPTNKRIRGDRFRPTENGIAVFHLQIEKKGRYRFRALTDDLPAYGQGGPQPYLFSELFSVD
jgi:Big-like domain-containing protein